LPVAAEDLALMKKLSQSTPELIEKGKATYNIQCSVCHGESGKGDGPAGGTLQPPPRNFTTGEWKFGGGPLAVFQTLTKGSPGTSMIGYAHLSTEDRWSLVHYIRSFAPSLKEDKPDAWSALGGETKPVAAKPTQKTSIAFALKQMAQSLNEVADTTVVAEGMEASTSGGKIYQAQCLACHGLHGRGGIAVSQVSVAPVVYLKTRNFANATGSWKQSRAEFIRIVSKGLPGEGKPGIAGFTGEEWSQLYRYVQSLR